LVPGKCTSMLRVRYRLEPSEMAVLSFLPLLSDSRIGQFPYEGCAAEKNFQNRLN